MARKEERRRRREEKYRRVHDERMQLEMPSEHGENERQPISPVDQDFFAVDPNEPTYCYCDRVSFGAVSGFKRVQGVHVLNLCSCR